MNESMTVSMNLARGLTPLTRADVVKIIRFVQEHDAQLLHEIICEECPEHIQCNRR